MRNTLLPLALLGLMLAAAPLALAQEDNTTRPDGSADPSSPSQAAGPDDAAWVEDCPPDMMCAADAPEGNASDEPTRGPADGSCENCRGEDAPLQYGPEGCIECSGPAPTHEGSCMDGSAPMESCQRDVQYLDGGSPPPTETSHTPVNAEADDAAEKDVPAPAVALAIVGAGAALVLLGRRRQVR